MQPEAPLWAKVEERGNLEPLLGRLSRGVQSFNRDELTTQFEGTVAYQLCQQGYAAAGLEGMEQAPDAAEAPCGEVPLTHNGADVFTSSDAFCSAAAPFRREVASAGPNHQQRWPGAVMVEAYGCNQVGVHIVVLVH